VPERVLRLLRSGYTAFRNATAPAGTVLLSSTTNDFT
jgi:hypothetical protein